ncbi:hypothetical protein MMC13_008192 [Lambiella insularis]|nr:hypothetical protein [Lambiella insularis]
MGVNSLEQGGTEGPWILACDYCSWTTLDIDIKFDKSTNIAAQLWKLRYGFIPKPAYSLPTAETQERSDPIRPHLHDTSFAALKSFYKSQIASTDATNPLLSPSGDVNYASPSSLARIMNLYTGTGSYAKKTSSKPANMRESMDASEGLSIMSEEAEQAAIAKLQTAGWTGTTSTTQRAEQVHPVRFQDELWPVHTLLRTRRAKRCKTCRHILVKPESKISSSRFKLKLAAISYVPSMTIKPLQGPSAPAWSLESLLPSKPLQFLLVVRNPMFDAVKVTLATPTRTPGRFASDVTILCPQFEIGANSEVWDEALSGGNGKRSAKSSKPKAEPGEPEGKVAEAGKVWQKERNSTTVVVEVVCARIVAKDGELEEDEDVLEIPVFVRLEYETDVPGSPMTVGKYDKGIREVKDRRERRELAYWCVLGVGRIAKSTV